MRYFVCFLLLFFSTAHAQDSTETVKTFRQTRNFIWYTPSRATTINGVAVGIQAADFHNNGLRINGINADAGLLTTFAFAYGIVDHIKSWQQWESGLHPDSVNNRMNGISISGGGLIDFRVNGITISGLMCGISHLRGVSISGLLSNVHTFEGIVISGISTKSLRGRGIQIGLFNYCRDLKGIQIGLWNKNGRRGLPFVNWGW